MMWIMLWTMRKHGPYECDGGDMRDRGYMIGRWVHEGMPLGGGKP